MKSIYSLLAALTLIACGDGGRKNPLNGSGNYLIIGDSISIGYGSYLIERIQNETNFNAERIPDNARTCVNTMHNLRNWLGDTKWDLITFNHGLHEVFLFNGKPRISIDFYKACLREEIQVLRETGAQIYFITSTPVHPESEERGLIEPYNEAALEVMAENYIDVIDLYGFIIENEIPSLGVSDVHYTPENASRQANFIFEELINK